MSSSLGKDPFCSHLGGLVLHEASDFLPIAQEPLLELSGASSSLSICPSVSPHCPAARHPLCDFQCFFNLAPQHRVHSLLSQFFSFPVPTRQLPTFHLLLSLFQAMVSYSGRERWARLDVMPPFLLHYLCDTNACLLSSTYTAILLFFEYAKDNPSLQPLSSRCLSLECNANIDAWLTSSQALDLYPN